MAKTSEYSVQCFELKRRMLVEGPRDVMWNEEDAVNRALVQSLRYTGVVAFVVDASVADGASNVRVLKQFGTVPNGFIERLRAKPPEVPRAPTSPRIRRG